MRLKHYDHNVPVLIEGEGGTATRHFVAGGNMAGTGVAIEFLEATPLGVKVGRADPYCDLLLTPGGIAVPAEKFVRTAPAQAARK